MNEPGGHAFLERCFHVTPGVPAPLTTGVLRARPRKSRETDGPEPNRNDDDAFPPSGSFGRAAGGSIRENQPGNLKLVPNITRQQVHELA